MVAKSKGANVKCDGREAGDVTFIEQGRRLGENCPSLPCLCKYISDPCANFQLSQETAPDSKAATQSSFSHCRAKRDWVS